MIHNKILNEESILKQIESKKSLEIRKKVIVRFSSFPNGSLHLGHAYTAIYNSILAHLNNGKFYLILDDTNPDKIDNQVYDSIVEDLNWLGITPDKILITSEYIDEIYECIKMLIYQGKAYLCNCPPKFENGSFDKKKFKEQNLQLKECTHEKNSKKQNIKLFDSFLDNNKKDSSVKVSWPIDKDKDNKSRVILRYIEAEHPLKPNYKIWPTMNFAVPFMDKLIGTTDILRGPELLKDTDRQKYIHKIIKSQNITYTAGTKISSENGISRTSDINKAINNGLLEGFDDPRVFTIKSFKRRGFSPQAIWSYILSLKTPEYSKIKAHAIKYSEDNIRGHNKKFLDVENILKTIFITTPKKIRFTYKNRELNIFISHIDLANIKNTKVVLHDVGVCRINMNNIIFEKKYQTDGLPHIYWLSEKEKPITAFLKSGHIIGYSSVIIYEDFINFIKFFEKLINPEDPISRFLKFQFSEETIEILNKYNNNPNITDVKEKIIEELNLIIRGKCLYNEQLFNNIELTEQTLLLIKNNPRGSDLMRLNRLLLEKVYPNEILKSKRNLPFHSQGLLKKLDYNINDIIQINDLGLCRVDSISPFNLIFCHK